MATRQLVADRINRFLESAAAEVLCISGDWGIGKTYLWNDTLKKAASESRLGLKEYAYVSLFGIDSVEALKLAIYENTESLKQNWRATALNTLKLRKFRTFAELVPKVGSAIEKLNPLYFLLVTDQIVCIDDLERKSTNLEVKDVLGLISLLKEQRRCKVVLLLNDNELRDEAAEQFESYFEKTVDIHLRLKPALEDSVAIALAQDDNVSTALKEHCLSLGISNIRVIKKIEQYARDLEPLLKNYDAAILKQAIHSLTLLGWSHYQPTVAPTVEFLKSREYGSRLVEVEGEEPPNDKEAAWNAMLDSYNFGSMGEFDHELLKSIGAGYFDPDAVRKHAEALDKKVKLEALDGSFEAAWNAYHDGFDNDQDVVLEAIYSAFKQAVKTISFTNLDGTVRLFKDLGRKEQANGLLAFYVEHRDEPQSFWDLEVHAFGDNVKDPDVTAAIKQKHDSFGQTVDLADVLGRMGSNKGWSEEEIGALATLPTDEFYKLFKETRGRPLRRLISGALLTDRVSNPSNAMKKVTATAKQALEKIGKESKINARRVGRYGMKVEPETGE